MIERLTGQSPSEALKFFPLRRNGVGNFISNVNSDNNKAGHQTKIVRNRYRVMTKNISVDWYNHATYHFVSVDKKAFSIARVIVMVLLLHDWIITNCCRCEVEDSDMYSFEDVNEKRGVRCLSLFFW